MGSGRLLRLLLAVVLIVAGAAGWQVFRSGSLLPPAVAPSSVRDVYQVPTEDGLLLSLFLLSDLHISADNPEPAKKLEMALQDLIRFDPPVDAIILGGDLTENGREQDYEALRRILSRYRLPPIYGLMGNHDYYDIWYGPDGRLERDTVPNGKTDAQARERFVRFMNYDGRPYHDVWINGVHLIMLSQEAYLQERPEVGEGAWYSDEQLNWLRQIMAAHTGGEPALIFIHQPLPPEGQDGGSHRLIRANEFREILRPYRNVFVFSGHTHRPLESPDRYVRQGNLHWFSNASVGRTRKQGPSVPDPVQGLYIQVYKDRVVVRGREFSTNTWIPAAHWTVALE
ncbi:MAG TPA: metallophosphoesterase [Symbiobacteriaceae bacterium]